jgi:hypothetical protein
MNRNAGYVAREIGKTENWVKRNANRYPHHRAGKSYFWTDDDIADMLTAMRVRPDAPADDGGALRPITGRRSA